jgi:hypothetical protein
VLYLKLLEALISPKKGLVKCFNLENKALRPIGDLTINGIHVDTDIWMRILFLMMASVTKQEMVEAFKNDATPGVQASISALNVIKKKMR